MIRRSAELRFEGCVIGELKSWLLRAYRALGRDVYDFSNIFTFFVALYNQDDKAPASAKSPYLIYSALRGVYTVAPKASNLVFSGLKESSIVFTA